MNEKPIQVIGLCRFSYPALGGFQVEHETIEDRIAYLYAPERLEERFALFESVALPGLKAQTDPDFEFMIVVGDQMPVAARRRLDDLVADMHQAHIIALPPGRQRDVMKDVLRAARVDPSRGCIQFRFDDDDAVAVDYIARLRQAVEDTAGLCADNKTVAFDWTQGMMCEFGADGIKITPTDRQLFVAALGMHIRGKCPQTIMSFGHIKLAKFMPTIRFPKPLMYLRGINGYNDSRQKGEKPIPMEWATDDDVLMLRERFAIDVDAVRRAFAAIDARGRS